eukprot:TRINITY_DN11500_c0_g1_i1.p2 TRINITY_DN11500_c0_g1~~TRINITY_DN11500_c0_g1_i1.p2  ORF type:complete len:125 (-),score=27.73 TRINITY_DN11500_c0_g1_i1:42-416(-)
MPQHNIPRHSKTEETIGDPFFDDFSFDDLTLIQEMENRALRSKLQRTLSTDKDPPFKLASQHDFNEEASLHNDFSNFDYNFAGGFKEPIIPDQDLDQNQYRESSFKRGSFGKYISEDDFSSIDL